MCIMQSEGLVLTCKRDIDPAHPLVPLSPRPVTDT
jgi:hypothetical protein